MTVKFRIKRKTEHDNGTVDLFSELVQGSEENKAVLKENGFGYLDLQGLNAVTASELTVGREINVEINID